MKDERKVRGGVARAQALTPERRSEIARMGALAKHGKDDPAARAARKKAEKTMARIRASAERFARELAGPGATLMELDAAAANVSELLKRRGYDPLQELKGKD